MSRRLGRVTLLPVLAIALALVSACGSPIPSRPQLSGTIRVHVERAAGVRAPFGSEDHARLIGPDGSIAADWQLAAEGATPLTIPEGGYTLTAFPSP